MVQGLNSLTANRSSATLPAPFTTPFAAMTTRLRPPGFGAQARASTSSSSAPHRPRPLGDGARLRRDRSMLADAKRRYGAAAGEDEALKPAAAPTPDRSPQGGGERAVLGEREEPNNDAALTPLTRQARALYEGGVVPVRELARLCGVSVPGLYYHIRKQRWRRRRSAVPRDPAKSERRKRRYRAMKAMQQAAPRGLKARDPDGQAQALARAERASALSGAALSRALARQEAEAKARILSLMTRALRDLAIANGERPKRARAVKEVKPRRRPYQWRPMSAPPSAWAERKR